MSLKQAIQEDLKAAMREKAEARLGSLRMLTAAIKQREVDERIELDDARRPLGLPRQDDHALGVRLPAARLAAGQGQHPWWTARGR